MNLSIDKLVNLDHHNPDNLEFRIWTIIDLTKSIKRMKQVIKL